jgi:hypothetical protein
LRQVEALFLIERTKDVEIFLTDEHPRHDQTLSMERKAAVALAALLTRTR